MSSNELFSDESSASEDQSGSRRSGRLSGSRFSLKGFGRLGFALSLLLATLIGVTAGAVVGITPAFATSAITCIDPASAGTAVTFHAGVSSYYTVECEEETGTSGVSAYPTIAVNASTVPADGNPTLATSCTTGTSGSGATEQYIEECKYSDTPTAADESGTAYTANFTATPGAFAGSTLTPITSGTLSVTINAPTVTCIDPASAGSSTTFFEGSANSYTVECEEQSGLSSITAYPSSIAINTGSLPADGNPAFATSTSSSPACTTGTSGSGTTEEYILECALSDTPTTSDGGSYPLTFTPTGAGGVGTATSGTLTVTISPPSTTCSTPAAGGTSVSWVDGTAETETLDCYSQGFAATSPGNYPASITINSGSLPSDASEATSLSSSPACTTATSGSGTSEEYELECAITDTPVTADNGTYHVTFLATGGSNGAPNAVSGTLTITISQPAPSWETDTTKDGNYFSAIKGVPFCYDIGVTTSTSGGATTGSPYSLPLTSLTAGTTPSGVTNYQIENVNLALGTAQLCGTNNNNAASAPVTMAPVATNSGGSATDSIPLWSQGECTWTTTSGTISMFDTNQDLETAGSQSAFGAAITNGVTGGTSKNYPTCTGGVGVSASGGLGDAWTINTANPLPTPTDTNPSASQGDLPSSNLDLTSASSGSVGGCWGAVNILASTSTTSFGSGSTADMTLPSTWANGGDCSYGSLGSNSAGGNTDTAAHGPTGDANCPPSQADVNAGLVDCTLVASSGNDENGSTNYTSLDLFYNNQPVPQAPTATLSTNSVVPGDTVSVTGGTNWWGSADGAPNSGPYGDFQNDAYEFYPVSAPSVYIGTSRATAVPVLNSTVTISSDSYACTGAESSTVGPNPCTLTVGAPSGTFTVPSNLSAGSYNIYIDESNTTPLPGNGPNDSYQTARGTNLGTAESATSIGIEGVAVVKTSTSSSYTGAGQTLNYNYAVTNNGPDTLTNIAVSDNLIPSANISCPSTTLSGFGSENCSGSYVTTQADADRGYVTNTATVSATTVNSETVTSAPSSATVDETGVTPSLSLSKSTNSAGYGAAGQTLNYSYLVTNTGIVTVSAISVSDNLINSVSCPDSSLAPSASETCAGSYTTTQADVDNGSVTNTATASGTAFTGSVSSNPSSVTVDANEATSSVTLTKSTLSTGYASAGQTITYSYLVTNTGTTTESNIGVSDNLIQSVSCPSSTLAPSASETCTGSYVTTQADVDAGSVTNTATAQGTNPSSATIESNQSSVTVSASYATSSLSLTKTTLSSGYGAAGQTIDYDYVVTNTGTTTESSIAVSDNLISNVSCPYSTLAPNVDETCTGSYVTTQADVDAGSVTNNATATGVNPQAITETSNESSVTVQATGATSGLALVKSAVTSAYGAAGDVLDYDYTVTNTGTTTVSDIAVTDNLVASVSCPDSSLAPNGSETCTGSYSVSQADVDAGNVTNTATASGTDSDGKSVTSNSSSVTVPASNATSTLSLTKSSSTANYSNAGDTVDYSYLLTNTGTTTLSGAAVSDDLVSSVSCPGGSLAPGGTETCTGSYTVTAADVTNGSVTNTATATASNPQGTTVTSNQSSVSVPSTYTTTASMPTSQTAALGGTDSDIAQVTGNAIAGNPGGSVTFYECGPTATPAPCTSQSDQVGGSVSVTASGNDEAIATSASFVPTSTGYWCFGAYYQGGSSPKYLASSDESTHECFDVTAGSTSTQTTMTKSTIVLGHSDTDSATITGNAAGGSPTGSVTFYECGPTSSVTPCTSQSNQVGGAETLSAGANHTSSTTSASFTPTSAGYWCFAGYYSGDSNYQASSDTTIDECFDVTPAASTTTTTPAIETVSLGSSNSDNASVTGNTVGGAPSGSVTFYECGPTSSPAPCNSTAQAVGPAVTLTAGAGDVSYASSANFTPTAVGYWCFAAVYSSSTNYSSSSDTSTSECFDVIGATITSFTPASGPVGTVVTIKGTDLGGATKVTIDGVKATISSNTATKIKVTVAAGTHTGYIKVVTPDGNATSATEFKVT
ncbi:MAG: hypothetical protein WAM97_17835 [Acidimicrobiales bacterium]